MMMRNCLKVMYRLLVGVVPVALLAGPGVRSQLVEPPVPEQIRVFERDDIGPSGLSGVAFPRGIPAHLEIDEPEPGWASLVVASTGTAASGDARIALHDPINLAVGWRSDGAFALLLLDESRDDLVEIEFDAGASAPQRIRRFGFNAFAGSASRAPVPSDPAARRVVCVGNALRRRTG